MHTRRALLAASAALASASCSCRTASAWSASTACCRAQRSADAARAAVRSVFHAATVFLSSSLQHSPLHLKRAPVILLRWIQNALPYMCIATEMIGPTVHAKKDVMAVAKALTGVRRYVLERRHGLWPSGLRQASPPQRQPLHRAAAATPCAVHRGMGECDQVILHGIHAATGQRRVTVTSTITSCL